MSEMIPDNSLHEYYNEKFESGAKKYERVIDQLNTKISNLKSEISVVNNVNKSLRSKLHSANNMIRILTSNRDLDYDFSQVDYLIRTKLIENNCSGKTEKNNCQNKPKAKKVDSAKNAGLMKVQNNPILQRRQFLKTQHNQVTSSNNIIETQKPKIKPASNATNTKTSKIPISTKSLKGNLANNNKENIDPSKKTSVANKKAKFSGVKSTNIKKSIGNTFMVKNSTNHLKVENDTERKEMALNKTYTVNL